MSSAASAPGREPSEFAGEATRLGLLASLPSDDPGRPELREQLIMTFLPLGHRIAARYAAGRPGSREDLRQVASIAVLNAVDRWNPDRADGDVLGYFVPCIRGELLRWFRDRTWATRVPRRLKDLSVAIDRVTGELTQQLGHTPRPSDLAGALEVDLDEVLEALRAEANHVAMTLDAPGSHDQPPLADQLSTEDPQLSLVEDLHMLRPLLDGLPERERRILVLRFYGGRTQSQIAAEIGISQMHVSRLLARSLTTMRRAVRIDQPNPPDTPAPQ